jgi:hypothetical protein
MFSKLDDVCCVYSTTTPTKKLITKRCFKKIKKKICGAADG